MKAYITGNEIYDRWQIPRGLLNAHANQPVDAIDVIERTANGVTRKYYSTRDVIRHFDIDSSSITIED